MIVIMEVTLTLSTRQKRSIRREVAIRMTENIVKRKKLSNFTPETTEST